MTTKDEAYALADDLRIMALSVCSCMTLRPPVINHTEGCKSIALTKAAAALRQLADEYHACYLHAESIAESLDQLREEHEQLAELVEEIVDSHADPDSPFFNDCNPEELCAWCVEAKALLAEAKMEGK